MLYPIRWASYYFGSEDPIGQQIIYSGSDGYSYEFTVVGVYEYNAAIFGKQDTTIPEKDRSTTMYIPATTANKLNHSEATNGYTYISVLLKTGADQNQAETDIQSFFGDKYAKNEKWQVTTYNMSSDMGIINTVINVVTVAISFIAAISLIVGGVGVMNIMLVSITERTKEIGIRKALGAKNKAIKQQFLIESVVLCLVGGIIGILIGILFGFILGKSGNACHQQLLQRLCRLYYHECTSVCISNYPLRMLFNADRCVLRILSGEESSKKWKLLMR